MALPVAVPVPVIPWDDYRLAKLRELAGRYEIRSDYVSKLRQLEAYEIVIVCDDSGSMSNTISGSPSHGTGDPYGKRHTRWDELKHYVSIVTDIAGVLDTNGLDIYFLNRPALTGITNSGQIQTVFSVGPNGYTPIPRVLKQIFGNWRNQEKKLLVILATDGKPTDDNGNDATSEFYSILHARSSNIKVSIIACTDDNATMDYLNNIDHIIPSVDVNDDYMSEAKEVARAQGNTYAFSFGDYVVKTLLGPVDTYFDNLDEVRHTRAAMAYTASNGTSDAVDACCRIM
jgi:hypothetical protein